MARRAKPWWWEQYGQYCVTIKGKRHFLGPDLEAAEKRFHELMAKPEPKVATTSVAAIIDQFLDWTQTNRAEETYLWYRKYLQSFLDHLTPQNLQVDRLKPEHVEKWVHSKKWGGSSKRGAITAVARVMSWAEKKGKIDENPIRRRLEKPPAGKRERSLTKGEYSELLKHVTDEFKDLVVTAWETGARPQEITKVESRHVDLINGRWVFPVEESKGKKAQRIVYLSETALEITKRLMKDHPEGPIFRNRNANPWTRTNVASSFFRLKKKIGVKYRLYDFRFSFCTNGLKNGVDPITMQHLMGHKDLSMISKIYALVGQDHAHMRKAAMQAAK